MPDSTKNNTLLNCSKCRRLATQFKRLRKSYPDYWNQPVPGEGATTCSLMIVGLAPGMHGANKTGRPFIGDASGDLLHQTLASLGLTDKIRVTNAVKCLPIKNLPAGAEIKNCSRFLSAEIAIHGENPNPVIFALGGVAHRAVISAVGLKQADYKFGHGEVHDIPGLKLVDSYHCSRYNTQTGRLTAPMFLDAMKTAHDLSYH